MSTTAATRAVLTIAAASCAGFVLARYGGLARPKRIAGAPRPIPTRRLIDDVAAPHSVTTSLSDEVGEQYDSWRAGCSVGSDELAGPVDE